MAAGNFILPLRIKKIKGINRPVVSKNRKMKMGTGTLTCITHSSYPGPLGYPISFLDGEGIKVGVHGAKAARVSKNNEISVDPVKSDSYKDLSLHGGPDRGSPGGGKINRRMMQPGAAAEGIIPPAEG